MGTQRFCDKCKRIIVENSREHWKLKAEAFQTDGFEVDLCPLCLDIIRREVFEPIEESKQ